MRRRKFLGVIGGAAVAWPMSARAQQGERMRRIAVMIVNAESDPEGQARIAALRDGLQKLGWTEGLNLRIDFRWAAGDADRIRTYAAEFVRLKPEVILANSTPVAAALRDKTHQHSDRIYWCLRSDRYRADRQPCAPGRPYHRLRKLRAIDRWEVAASSQGTSARCESGRIPIQSAERKLGPHLRGDQSRRLAAGRGADRGQGARCCRDRKCI